MLRNTRLLLWALVAVAAIAGTWLALRPAGQQTGSTELSLGSIGGPFTLVGSDGRPFNSAKLHGKPAAIFFGFTHCPDVCPTTLARLTRLRRQLGSGDDSFAIVFVTVDPERDRPEDVGRYASLFDTPVIGLTGTVADIERVKSQFGVYSGKVPQPGGDYSVDHTATVFLMDRHGKFLSTLSPQEGDAVALDKLRRAVG
jgi:protein SCO1/2